MPVPRSHMQLLAVVVALVGHVKHVPAQVETPQPPPASQPAHSLPNHSEPPITPASNPPPKGGSSSSLPTLTDLSWNKGGFRIVPYGAFWAHMVYATQRTSPGAFTLFVFSREDQGEPAFTLDVRRTRLGLDVTGPRIASLGNAENGGKLEIDFQGEFITENRASVLLRQAYWEIKNEQFRVLVGQTWDVISPLIPGTLNYGTGYFAGNVGFRRAQFRWERYLALADDCQWTFQASLNQDIVMDFPTEPGVRREFSSWPVVQGRTALALKRKDHKPIELGISGHIGETGFDFLTEGPPPLNLPPRDDARFTTWSFNVDLRVPITEQFGFQGEFFTGANLSAFLGGIGQGVCPCLRVPIRSTGGWADLWYHWTPRLHSHMGLGLDDPRDSDTLFGRSQNKFLYANVVYHVTERLITGIEVTYWKTLYRETRVGQIPTDQLTPSQPGESVTIDWMVKYAF